ncbi:Kinase domain protein [uncultured Eubacteriales bacterium]|uniref:non-specific serine/threonine protein kinase n=1 Tax=uncultured Eubacteriales bacterium TaxID=172733 RepID=A0A212JY48_9FIRM|nr:Kinase domain protein [uncultured Eubacteriales bacterium]
MDQYIGKLLDNRYEILERIGSGGMAVVYKARCHRLNRLVAVKILKSDLAQDAEFRRRFHDESQAVAMLSHPNIVAVYDVSRSDQLDYIVMELIDGITLKQYMQKKGEPLSWRESLHFITQIMKALGHAHSRGIIHRDIKPHNIMVLRDGSVKVADFGIARLASAAQNTLTQEALGSVHYISPEQAKGSHIDNRSDIYSAGVVLYEMLTGRLPYEGDSPISVAIQHINSIPLSPREINPDIPEALEAITMKAMAPKVDQRYLSADAMLVDLEEFRKNPNINFEYTSADLLGGSDEPTQVLKSGVGAVRAAAAPPPRAEDRAERPVRRRRVEEDGPDDEEDGRRRRGKNSSGPAIAAVGAIVIFLLAVVYFLWTVISGVVNPADVTYTVPDLLTGITIDEARADKDLLGDFTIEKGKTLYNKDVPEGQIVSQDPAPGTTVKSGGLTIKVDVSGGDSDSFVIEDFHNKSASVAKATLENRGVHVTINEVNDPTVTQTYVISQSIPEGNTVYKGDTVTLTVSLGPEKKQVTMISIIGSTQESAEKQLNDLGLSMGSVTPTYDAEAPVGTVIWQSVAVSVSVQEGTVVDIKTSLGPDPSVSPPPDVSVSPSTSPSTSPSNSETPKKTSTTIKVELPTDRDLVSVVITVAGETSYSDPSLATSFRKIRPTIWGSGLNQEVCVFIDGVLVDTQYIDFGS